MTTYPALTMAHVERLGATSAGNLARLVFERARRGLPQYAGFLDGKVNVRLVKVLHDPSVAVGTFSRYEVGDVLLAWDEPNPLYLHTASRTTAFCPRAGWNVGLVGGYVDVPQSERNAA